MRVLVWIGFGVTYPGGSCRTTKMSCTQHIPLTGTADWDHLWFFSFDLWVSVLPRAGVVVLKITLILTEAQIPWEGSTVPSYDTHIRAEFLTVQRKPSS